MDRSSHLLAQAERCQRAGDLLQAGHLYGEILEQEPDNALVWCGLGEVYRALGQPDYAVDCYRRALDALPEDAGLHSNLGTALIALGRLDEAATSFEHALRLRPDLAEAASNLGLTLLNQGKVLEAVLHLQEALRLRPDLAEVHNNLGLALLHLGKEDEALSSFRDAVRLRPSLADAHNNLGLTLATRGHADEALACYERALQIDANHVGALTNLGNARKDEGCLGDAVTCYRKAVELRPYDSQLHSNLLLALNYQPGANPAQILRDARCYADRHAAPLANTLAPHAARLLAGRRLRIGYVSADFREHPVAYFLEPIVAAHDHERFEIVCYAAVAQPDAVTERLQGYANRWRWLTGISDEQAAELIRQDGIDILVDLSGHTGGNRLLVFARKPAPVQVSYLGYLGTTGVPAIDYYITDDLADPPGQTDAHYQEQLVRLPECGFCYQPGPAPAVHPEPPTLRSGRVTFGCLNALAKVSDEVLTLWARVLAAVPGSRLLLPTAAGRHAKERVLTSLARNAVARERVLLLEYAASRFDYLERYNEIDIGLDPFPYNGVTTTCDALWMGVPLVTLAGTTSVSRQGVRFLRTVGLDDLIADETEQYVRVASDLARDVPRLAALRRGLRERMRCSPLMDSPASRGISRRRTPVCGTGWWLADTDNGTTTNRLGIFSRDIVTESGRRPARRNLPAARRS
jgi:predicted O-linked N-acetylglucosamine transferase (SPINDLY family)